MNHFFLNNTFLLLLLLIQLHAKNCENFGVTTNNNGEYEIIVKNQTWLKNANTFIRSQFVQYDTDSKSLQLQHINQLNGTDILGSWVATSFQYSFNYSDKIVIECRITKYDHLDAIRFTQIFPYGLVNTSVPNTYHRVASAFPSFHIDKIDGLDIGYLSYGGMMAGDMEKTLGNLAEVWPFINTGPAAGPFVLFNPHGDTLIISQMNEFMASSAYYDYLRRTYSWGVLSGINEIPMNYACDFIIYYSENGINQAMEGWGKQLQIFHQKNLAIKETDLTDTHLSYWTDNGAYYYFLTENNKTYQETVMDIINFNQNQSIPFRTFQYDSWWYNRRYSEGAVIWDGNAPTDAFPDSMQYIYNQTKLPVIGHNKFWDSEVYYAKQNGGSYNFILDEQNFKGIPDDERFWNDLFANSTKWGLRTYEQDWMDAQTLEYRPLMTNITLGKIWLKQMADAALRHGITIQYCMSLSRHILQSLENTAVTQARVTNDYMTNWNYRGEQWRIGISAMFARSIGLSPFKDVFWSTSVQPGNKNGNIPDGRATECCPELNAAVSTLSGGPVGAGDKIGVSTTNKTLIMRSCNDEGLLLKPTKGITAIDEMIYYKALGAKFGTSGEVVSAYSLISNYTFGILLAADVYSEHQMDASNLGFKVHEASYFWKDGSNQNILRLNGFDSVDKLKIDKSCSKKNFCLYHITPRFIVNGTDVAILGEQSKWVPVSPKRVLSIRSTPTDPLLQLEISGALNETIQFSFLINNTYKDIECSFEQGNIMKVLVDLSFSSPRMNCY